MKSYTNYFKTSPLQYWRSSLLGSLKTLLTFILVGFISVNLSAQITIDGNPSDWANFTTNPLYPTNAYARDANNTNDNQFTQGSKDGNDVSTWAWTNGQTNNKGDISNAGAILRNEGGINYLYFCGDRAVNNGDAAIGFWFFKNTVAPVGATSGTFSGTHANGDLLVVSHFTQGGGQADIFIYKWMNGGLTAPVTSSEARVNSASQPVPAGFRYASANYPIGDFFEGRVNLNSLGVAPCFANFLLETRNSQSITASLQDFAAGNFTQQTPPPDLAVTQPTCTVATGAITITSATTGLTFKLDNGAFAPYPTGGYTGLAAGSTHSVTAQTVDGCISNPASKTIGSQPPTPPGPTLDKVDPTCTVATGTITVTSSTDGLTFKLDDGAFEAYPTNGYTGLAAGSTHTVTSKNADGCISEPTSKSIATQPATPDRPVVTLQEATICGTTAIPTITVSCPIVGTYTFKQTGETDKTFNYNGTNGPVIFNVKPGLGGFSITVTNTDGCTSAATDCSNYTTNSCPTQSASAKGVVSVAPAIQPETKLTVFPNPFNDKLKFSFKPAVSGQATLDLYNMLGQKVKTVFQGRVEAGQVQNIEYNVPNAQRSNLIYMFRVGNQKLSGKLLGLK